MRINAILFKFNIIQVYAPTTEHDDEGVEQFYTDLKNALEYTEMGDSNAKIRCGAVEDVVAAFGLGTTARRLYTWKSLLMT